MINSIIKNRFYTLFSIFLLIILWKFLALYVGNEIKLPSPESTFLNLLIIIKEDHFLLKILGTLKRCLISFFISFVLGVFLGTLAGIFKPIYYLVNPVITIAKSIPTVSIILIALLWLGAESPILVNFLVIFPIIFSNILEGVRHIDYKLIEMAQVHQVKKWRIFTEVYLPLIFPYILASTTTSLGLSLKVIVAAEVWGDTRNSIGEGLLFEKINLNISGLFAWTIIAILISSLFDYSLKKLESHLSYWKL